MTKADLVDDSNLRFHPFSKKYLEIIGEEIPEAWSDPGKISELKKKLADSDADKYSKMRGYELPRGWRVSYNEKADRRYGYGMATDWLYAQYGIYSITTELWNPLKDIPGLELAGDDNNPTALEKALMKLWVFARYWCEENTKFM